MIKKLNIDLPYIQNSITHNNIKTVYVGQKKEKKREIMQNVHIGMTNFNSKLYEKRKSRVSENKQKNLNPFNFGILIT